MRERRVLCYLWCYGKQECEREKGSLLLVVLWKTRVSERVGFFVTCGVAWCAHFMSWRHPVH